MIKKLTRHGNELVLVLDPSLLAQLQIDEDTLLDVKADGRSLVVSPTVDAAYREQFERANSAVNERYDATFKRLAE
ncbi:MAG: hypothetical protein AB7O59_19210 [Pirellulales bacterium]